MTATTASTRPRRPLRVALAEGDAGLMASMGRLRHHLERCHQLTGHLGPAWADADLHEAAWAVHRGDRFPLDAIPAELRPALLPVGPDKAPISPKTGRLLTGWQHPDRRFSDADLMAVPAVGLRCGPLPCGSAGIVCLDFDAPAGDPDAADRTFVEAFGRPASDLPATWGWASGKPGRRQLAFMVPAELFDAVRTTKVLGRADLQIRWAKHQSVIWGLHPDTGRYRWLEGSSPHDLPMPAPAPAWLLQGQPAPAAPAPAPAPAAPGLGQPVRLEQLLPRDLESLAVHGAPEGQRNQAAFTLACSLLALHDAAAAAGLPTAGTPEDALLQFASRCQPPLDTREVRNVFSSACSAPRSTDPGWPDRLRFQLNRHAREQRHQQQSQAAPAAPQLATPAPAAEDAGPAGAAPSPAGVVSRKTRVGSDEVLTLLPYHLGALRLNIRSGEVHSGARGVISANEISRLYLELSRPFEIWPKDATADGITLLASRDPFDPVAEYLEQITAEPLPMEQWQQLDHHLLGITDPIAASFLPRFLISAAARVFEPGAYVRQVPVLIGSQERGKGELGRILFGAEHWVEGVGALDRDALMKAHTAWGVELAELDGVTRRADQEHLKAFITETADTYRKPYDRAPERHPRKFVFWGTANRPPLRDSSGSTRFVCIPIPDRPLPLEWARQHRDALWARALQQYRSGITWMRTSEAERLAVEARNADFTELDPWAEPVGEYLSNALRHGWRLPVKVADVLGHLEVEKGRQTNALAKRVREIAEGQGWRHGRRRPAKGADPVQGLWPPEQAVHPVHPEVGAGVHGSDPSAGLASTAAVHPVHPDSITVEKEGEGQQGDSTPAEPQAETQEGFERVGVHGVHGPQTDCAAVQVPCTAGVHSGVHGGVHSSPAAPSTPSTIRTTSGWVELALAELRLAPHFRVLLEVMSWLRAHPAAPAISQREVTSTLERLHAAEQAAEQQDLLALEADR